VNRSGASVRIGALYHEVFMLRPRLAFLVLFVAAGLCHGQAARVLYQARSEFNGNVTVEQDSRGIRSLVFDDGATQSCMDVRSPNRLVLPYTRAIMSSLAFHPEPRRILIVGVGGGTMPMFLHRTYPELIIDNVDIDPVVVKVAREFFGLVENDKVRIHIGDGRKFIQTTENRYDIIFLDAYGADSIPYSLATRQFLEAVRAKLAPGGIVVSNVWSQLHNRLYWSMLKTYQTVFDEVHLIHAPEGSSNRIVVALPGRSGLTRAAMLQRAAEVRKSRMPTLELPRILQQGYQDNLQIPSDARVLEDGPE
jgi:spermidine synthase